jgi:hypothetical protein
MSADAEQPWVPDSAWLLLEESHSKFPVLADVPAARVKLARKFNRQQDSRGRCRLESARRARQGAR